MQQCFAWLCLMAIMPVHSQTGFGYGLAPAPLQRIVQIAKPEIPTLVYYKTGLESTEDYYGDQGEIRFNDWSGDVIMQNIPESFQYRIECDTPHSVTDNLWITPAQIAEQISPATCRQLISKNKITLKTSYTSVAGGNTREIDFIPIPASQTWRGSQLNQGKTGIPARKLSSCCRQSECPTVCLQTPEPRKCFLEVYTIRTGLVYDNSLGAQFVEGVTGSAQYTTGGSFLHMRFKIPCDYCPLKNCVTNCSNGEFATRTSAYQVKQAINSNHYVSA
jgi:hypothetical protein